MADEGRRSLSVRPDLDLKSSGWAVLALVLLFLSVGLLHAASGPLTVIDDGMTGIDTGGGFLPTSPLLSWDDETGRNETIYWKYWDNRFSCPIGNIEVVPGPRPVTPIQDNSFVTGPFSLAAQPNVVPEHTDLPSLLQGGFDCPELDSELMEDPFCPPELACLLVPVPEDAIEFQIETDPAELAAREATNLTIKFETSDPGVPKIRVFAFSRDIALDAGDCSRFNNGANCTSSNETEVNLVVFEQAPIDNGTLNYTLTPADLVVMATLPERSSMGIAVEFSGMGRAGILPSEGLESWTFDFVMYGVISIADDIPPTFVSTVDKVAWGMVLLGFIILVASLGMASQEERRVMVFMASGLARRRGPPDGR